MSDQTTLDLLETEARFKQTQRELGDIQEIRDLLKTHAISNSNTQLVWLASVLTARQKEIFGREKKYASVLQAHDEIEAERKTEKAALGVLFIGGQKV